MDCIDADYGNRIFRFDEEIEKELEHLEECKEEGKDEGKEEGRNNTSNVESNCNTENNYLRDHGILIINQFSMLVGTNKNLTLKK